MPRLRSLIKVLAATAVAGVLLTSPASAGTPPRTDPAPAPAPTAGAATFGIQPATATARDKTRDSFTYQATPGAKKTDYVAVSNYSTSPLTLRIYATDAYNTADGGFTVLPLATKPRDVGLWVSFPTTGVTLAAKSSKILPFTLTVPADAKPGDHVGGIMLSLTTQAADAKGGQIAVESRVGTRLQVRVPGTLKAQLTVSHISTSYHASSNPFGGGTMTVSYTVANTGNVRLSGTQKVHVTSLFGGSKPSLPLANVKELLPGDQERVTATVKSVLPSFSSTAHISVVPTPVVGDIDPVLAAVDESASVATIPWPMILLLLALGAFGGVWVWRRRVRVRVRKQQAAKAKAKAAKTAPAKKTAVPATAAATATAGAASKAESGKAEDV
ncbi:protein of unknown function DUF916 cell surface putative [Catenulispora acidiphila DSM 44928]|uniref:DUF916 domain-containing protein n=1 Tax=Catenulispora acidiphila (strain DSM 44928 / JCM 14897 / NBRC 102108 / NRRL B-24433 / ID139908) TaxID=479433 RepID=C7PX52_CATAD|nr:DUF916 domain-containing protein [Catenulispora acidiphila]ACU69403.1 protein of unknown function DUF916 cell surface putative [Catenulispora acidiphila DSM 44928]